MCPVLWIKSTSAGLEETEADAADEETVLKAEAQIKLKADLTEIKEEKRKRWARQPRQTTVAQMARKKSSRGAPDPV